MFVVSGFDDGAFIVDVKPPSTIAKRRYREARRGLVGSRVSAPINETSVLVAEEDVDNFAVIVEV